MISSSWMHCFKGMHVHAFSQTSKETVPLSSFIFQLDLFMGHVEHKIAF